MKHRARPELPAGPYLVVGLARSGIAAGLALRERGETVIGVDAGAPAGLQELADAGVELHLGEDGTAQLEKAGTVIKSPGIPREALVIAGALARGMPVLGELEFGWRLLENEVIAVTGTNGKTTTVEWIGHIHRATGLPVAVAGNVGKALSGLVGRIVPDATIVCEASSFQLEDTVAFAPEAAVLLNISPDHLDRHGNIETYTKAKLKIFEHQTRDDVAVIPDDLCVQVDHPLQEEGGIGMGHGPGPDIGIARRARFGRSTGCEVCEHDGLISWNRDDGAVEDLLRTDELGVRGAHNVQNAMAAATVCLARGIALEAVREGLRTFKGVEHRLQEVASKGGVAYVNDSKATNVASTLVALDAYPPGTVHLILGGQGKGQDFSALAAAVQRTCRAVYLIGEDASQIVDVLMATDVESDGEGDAGSLGVLVHKCGDLEHALAAAAKAALPGEVVLLSPACASFDQFANYEARGERFRELVMQSA